MLPWIFIIPNSGRPEAAAASPAASRLRDLAGVWQLRRRGRDADSCFSRPQNTTAGRSRLGSQVPGSGGGSRGGGNVKEGSLRPVHAQARTLGCKGSKRVRWTSSCPARGASGKVSAVELETFPATQGRLISLIYFLIYYFLIYSFFSASTIPAPTHTYSQIRVPYCLRCRYLDCGREAEDLEDQAPGVEPLTTAPPHHC